MVKSESPAQQPIVTGRSYGHAAQGPATSKRITELPPFRGMARNGRQDLVDGAPIRVLVVDYDTTILEVVAMMFKALGCSVSIAHGCRAAVNRLATMRFNLVVSEFSMSESNGCQLAALVKANSPQTIVLIMTRLCQSEVTVELDFPQVDGWIFKPFGFEELLDILELIQLPALCPQYRA